MEFDITKTVLELLKIRASRTYNKKSGLIQFCGLNSAHAKKLPHFDFCTNLPQTNFIPNCFSLCDAVGIVKFDQKLSRNARPQYL